MEQFLIYLIVFLIIAASSFKKKKQTTSNQPMPKQQQATKPASSFEEFLKKISEEFVDEKNSVPEAKPVTQPITRGKVKPSSTQNKRETNLTPLTESLQMEKLKISKENLEEDIEYEYSEYQIHSVEEAQKAFIFSEVWNRKYF